MSADNLDALQDLLSEALSGGALSGMVQKTTSLNPSITKHSAVDKDRSGEKEVHANDGREEHEADKPFQCGFCSVTFELNLELVSHVKNHALTKPFQCAICKMSYNSNPELTTHVRVHNIFIFVPAITIKEGKIRQKPPVQIVTVPTAPSGSDGSERRTAGWRRHTRSSMRKQLRPTRKCKCFKIDDDDIVLQCNFDLNDVQCKKENKEHAAGSEEVVISCPHCMARLETSEALKLHLDTEHSRACSAHGRHDSSFNTCQQQLDTQSLTCAHCGKLMKTKASLKKHIKNVHEGENREHSCAHCSLRFKTKGTLTEHVCNVHEAAQPGQGHACPHCGKVLKSKHTLRNHIREMHTDSEKEPPRMYPQNQSTDANIDYEGDTEIEDESPEEVCKSTSQPVSRSSTRSTAAGRKGSKPYACTECTVHFKRKGSLAEHIKNIHRGRNQPHPCAQCGKVLKSEAILKGHIRYVHQGIKPYRCCEPDCKMQFKSNRDLKVHNRNCHEANQDDGSSGSHTCPQCEKTVKSSSALREHIRHSHNNAPPDQGPAECSECQKSFQKRRYLTEHMKKVHGRTSASIHPCPVCGKVLTTKSILHSHMRGMHSGQRPWACAECPLRFKRKCNLDEHVRNIHAPYHSLPCPMCDTLCLDAGGLRTHLKTQHSHANTAASSDAATGEESTGSESSGVMVLQCPFCLIKCNGVEDFSVHVHGLHSELMEKKIQEAKKNKYVICHICGESLRSLEQHIRNVHSDVRPHHCDQCEESFKTAHALMIHKRLHSGEKPHVCDFCGKSFRHFNTWKYHRNMHLGTKPVRCDVCQKGFNSHPSLMMHKRRHHTGDKRYSCPHCTKKFFTPNNLRRHVATHTGERNFTCKLCDKTYKGYAEMRHHQKAKHGGARNSDASFLKGSLSPPARSFQVQPYVADQAQGLLPGRSYVDPPPVAADGNSLGPAGREWRKERVDGVSVVGMNSSVLAHMNSLPPAIPEAPQFSHPVYGAPWPSWLLPGNDYR